jgi:antitoxin component of RelBE/YafQ-DinJ toxin-antitoxin module
MEDRKKGSNKGRYNFLIDESVYKEFSAVCEELGMIRSKNLENHMKEFILTHKKRQ